MLSFIFLKKIYFTDIFYSRATIIKLANVCHLTIVPINRFY